MKVGKSSEPAPELAIDERGEAVAGELEMSEIGRVEAREPERETGGLLWSWVMLIGDVTSGDEGERRMMCGTGCAGVSGIVPPISVAARRLGSLSLAGVYLAPAMVAMSSLDELLPSEKSDESRLDDLAAKLDPLPLSLFCPAEDAVLPIDNLRRSE